MLRRLVRTGIAAAVLVAAPLTLDRPRNHGDMPSLGVNDLACSETTGCCYELGSICIVNGEARGNRRPATATCTPIPD